MWGANTFPVRKYNSRTFHLKVRRSRLFRFFRRFPRINVGGDSARIPFVEHASRESRVALPPKGRLRHKERETRLKRAIKGNHWVWHNVATYPSAGGRRVTRGMRVPRKEYARSRHQRLFEENVGKTGKDAIYELLSERFGSCIYARGRY